MGLTKGMYDGLNPSHVLWFIGVFNGFGALTIFMGSFDKFAAKLGAPFYMKDDFEYNTFSKTVQRFNGLLTAGSSAVVLCAAFIASSSNPSAHEFIFPIAFFADHLFLILFIIIAMVGNPGYFEEFAIFQSTLLIVGGAVALLIGWKIECDDWGN